MEFIDLIKDFISRYKLTHKQIKVLDIGCADLRDYSFYLIENCEDYIGIDINALDIQRAKFKTKDISKCKIYEMDVRNLKFLDKTFDLIVCNNVLAYTNQTEAINKIFDYLNTEGILVSFNNNTIQYSLYKIFHHTKPFLIEVVHSVVVIINTWFFKLTSIRLFHTVFNTRNSILKLLKSSNYKYFQVEIDKLSFPYNVINFYCIK